MSAMSGGSGGQDFDLNLAPIIDCFTVLLTYLLVSASFISLTAIDVGVAANGRQESAVEAKVPPYSLALNIKLSRVLEIKLTGGPNRTNQMLVIQPSMTGEWDFRTISKKLSGISKQFKTLQDVTVSAESNVEYKEIIRMIEEIKKVIPKVYIAG